MGKLAEAQQFTELALQRISAFDAPSITYLWQWQLGRLRQIQGDQKSALQAYTLAFETLQSLRRDLAATNPEIQFTFRDSVEPVYRELVDLILQPENLSQDNQDNLKQARNVIEALQLAELNNFFQEACLDAQPQPIARLDPHAAVVYSNRHLMTKSQTKQQERDRVAICNVLKMQHPMPLLTRHRINHL